MDLTKERKIYIDSLDTYILLRVVRFPPIENPKSTWLDGKTGEYWLQVLKERKRKNPKEYEQISEQISKETGWPK